MFSTIGKAMLILLIEDHQKLAQNIQTVLQANQYHVDIALDAKTAKAAVLSKEYDLVILDLGLPDQDGVELCKAFRSDGLVWPILILTARINIESKVEGLDSGADDYLTKPFLSEELLARVRALLRRDSTQKSQHVTIGSIAVDLNAKTVSNHDESVDLSPTEYRLLEALLLKRGTTVTASELYEKVWGDHDGEMLFSDTLKVTVARLRKKIGTEIISTAPGFGYVIK